MSANTMRVGEVHYFVRRHVQLEDGTLLSRDMFGGNAGSYLTEKGVMAGWRDGPATFYLPHFIEDVEPSHQKGVMFHEPRKMTIVEVDAPMAEEELRAKFKLLKEEE